MFKLSVRSFKSLEGVKPQLVKVVERAIQLTAVDFVVVEGVRSLSRQKALLSQGATETLASKHLTGDAVDLAAWLGTVRWELPLYCKIADAMKAAALEQSLAIRWGGAWSVKNFTTSNLSAEQALAAYVASRKSAGLRVFIDGPHFELV